ncbi:MAG: D-alanyl-D-alanine carboxypeptidase, partial [Eubacterium sp.]|nr:D-alanyl-D-alanine carboxypeptidase [Eubacterium sp.]
GFANCQIYEDDGNGLTLESVSVKGGMPTSVSIRPDGIFSYTFTSDFDKNKIKRDVQYNKVSAPIKKGDVVGQIQYSYDGKKMGSLPLVSCEEAKEAGYLDYLKQSIGKLFLVNENS